MYRMTQTPQRKDVRRRTDQEMHGAFIRATSDLTRQPSEGWYDMRRGRERWWGNLLRRIDELHKHRIAKEHAMQIPRIMAAYIEELYADEPRPTQAA